MEDIFHFAPEDVFQIIIIIGVAKADGKQQNCIKNDKNNGFIIGDPIVNRTVLCRSWCFALHSFLFTEYDQISQANKFIVCDDNIFFGHIFRCSVRGRFLVWESKQKGYGMECN